MDGASADEREEGGYASEVTVDSDGSQASAFGLRSALHKVEVDDELSEASSHDEDDRAVTERDRVKAWRTQNFLQGDFDFAYFFNSFEEAYSQTGRAVAAAWSKARFLADPKADIIAIKATATKVRKVDSDRNKKAIDKKNSAGSPFLRQPGKGTDPEDMEEVKVRFIEPLAQLMMDCGVGYSGRNAPATYSDTMSSLRRNAKQIARTHDVPTLYGATTTAADLKRYLASITHRGVVHVEPLVLEEFLRQSTSQSRAFNSLTWMCKNLQLGWPIDEIKQPDIKDSATDVTKSKQSLSAQPGMLRALEEAMQTAAEADDPTWLALLASWLQTMSNLHLDHLLRRSAPVELYDGWIVFFCKEGKQRHNRAGFYWGVPSRTSCNYTWTVKFLCDYNRRRYSDAGTAMMGMIFQTETHKYFSSRAVKALTIKAVAGTLSDPSLLVTRSWKMILPAAAIYLNFSPAEQLVISNLRDNEAFGDEVPITPKYTKGKGDKSRLCKLVCAEVFATLTKLNTQTFDEIPANRLEQLVGEARAKVETQQLIAGSQWRNPDVTAEPAGGGLKVKKSQTTFPRQLYGVPLVPNNRSGERYCADFQSNNCQGGDACPLGLHRCAALLRGGRTCNMSHPGSACRNKKRHAPLREEVTSATCYAPSQAAPEVELVLPEDIQEASPRQSSPECPIEQRIMPDNHENKQHPRTAGGTFLESPRCKAMPETKARPAPSWANDAPFIREMLPTPRHEGADAQVPIQEAGPMQPSLECPIQQAAMPNERENEQDPKMAGGTLLEIPTCKTMPSAKAQAAPSCVSDASVMRELLPRLRGERAKVRGTRTNPEPPKLVAKICREEGKGELWLGALPTATRMNRILEIKPSIQIYCFHAEPTQVVVDWGQPGMYIPGAIVFRCEMSNPNVRETEIRALRPCLMNSLRQGDNAYVHCISGYTRAPLAAAVMSAMLMGISIAEAKHIINQTRFVSFSSGRGMQGGWINQLLRESWTNAEAPTGFSCEVADRPLWLNTKVHATTMTDAGAAPICHHKERATCILHLTTETAEQAHKEFGGSFCPDCSALLRASLKSEVERFYRWVK